MPTRAKVIALSELSELWSADRRGKEHGDTTSALKSTSRKTGTLSRISNVVRPGTPGEGLNLRKAPFVFKKTTRHKVYLSRNCAKDGTAAYATKKRLAEQHPKKIRVAKEEARNWSTARTKQDWKRWVCSRPKALDAALSPKFLTRAVNRGELLSPIKRGPVVAVRFHDLRHTAVSHIITASVPLPLIAKIVGWSAGTMAKMAACYGHFAFDELPAAVEAISQAKPTFGTVSPRISPQEIEEIKPARAN